MHSLAPPEYFIPGSCTPNPAPLPPHTRVGGAAPPRGRRRATPYVYGDFAREIGRWALFMGGPWSPKQGCGPVAIKARHARRIRGKKVLWGSLR
jgi:hypothetical protein